MRSCARGCCCIHTRPHPLALTCVSSTVSFRHFLCVYFSQHKHSISKINLTRGVKSHLTAASYRRAPREPVHYGLVDGSQQVQRCSSRLSKSFICGSDRSQSKRPQFSPWMRSVLRVWDLEVTNMPAAMTSRPKATIAVPFLILFGMIMKPFCRLHRSNAWGGFRVGQT